MRKLVSAALLLSLIFSLFPAIGQAATAAVTPKLYLNGKQLETTEEPRIYQSSTLVPVRVVAEGLGFKVGWSQSDKRVDINDATNLISLTIDSPVANVNGNSVQLDATAKVYNSVTLVPIRFVAESLGLQVFYDSPTKSVHLYQSANETSPSDSTGSSGSEGSGTNAGSGATDPNAGTGSTGNTEVPANVQGYVTNVQYDGTSSITIGYEGVIKPNNAFTLTGPDRIVLDLPNAAFGANMPAGKMLIDSNPSLYQVRYSVGPDNPTTLRIVLDLSKPSAYQVTESEGQIQIAVLDNGSVPSDNTTPAQPGDTTGSNTGKVYKVVIDAGHGGKDPGAGYAGAYEKTFNLSIVLKIKQILDQDKRIQVTYTRLDDTYPDLTERVKIANNLKADAFVSIHANSSTSSKTNGTETYYYRQDSKSFADIMHKYLSKATGLRDNGVRSGNFKVIRETTMPAILLESGYLSNTADCSALFNPAIQDKIAAAVAAGIKEQLKLQ
ncbi:N-acetylmuramoyl-L-alanine amidase family protein [Paenibacillus kobensis]|uniref:N-acetylmuramoyl-L-alanine amidase family protein n=1 Tax=Paenibacillus kobensis TaxID=59841 RepID=UPI000FD91A54|nr:N-acetylmuramoyl-L-alanine amidase family protein [Paenibacillus kobensis]